MVHNYVSKADLSKGYWNPKRQLGVTKHFLRDNEAIIIRNTESKIKSNVWRFFFPN